MTRAEKRELYRRWHKQLCKMTLGQFEKVIVTAVEEHVKEAESMIEQALRLDHGFGDKRLAKVREKAQSLYDESRGRKSDKHRHETL